MSYRCLYLAMARRRDSQRTSEGQAGNSGFADSGTAVGLVPGASGRDHLPARLGQVPRLPMIMFVIIGGDTRSWSTPARRTRPSSVRLRVRHLRAARRRGPAGGARRRRRSTRPTSATWSSPTCTGTTARTSTLPQRHVHRPGQGAATRSSPSRCTAGPTSTCRGTRPPWLSVLTGVSPVQGTAEIAPGRHRAPAGPHPGLPGMSSRPTPAVPHRRRQPRQLRQLDG